MRTVHIFWREYWGGITRRSYLIFTFGFPIFMVTLMVGGGVALALAVQSALPPTDPRPIGLIDQASLFQDNADLPNGPVDTLVFDTTGAAQRSLAQGDIQAYYHIPADYWESGRVIVRYKVAPSPFVDGMVTGWIESRVSAQVPPDIQTRLDGGPSITRQGLTAQSTSFDEMSIIEPVIVFVAIYAMRLIGTFTASYMFDSITSEADDRTLEILITTVTPLQFIAGKFFGLLAVGLTQIGMWSGAAAVLVLGAGYLWGIDIVSLLLSWPHLGLALSVLAATYLLDQIIAAALGLKRVSGGTGHLLFGTVNAVSTIALLYAMYFVPRNPDTTVAVAASLFPLTASIFLLLRIVISEVPLWQVVLSQLLLWATVAAGLLWLRRLLQVNLVANATPVTWQTTLKNGWLGLKRLALRSR